MQAPCLFETHFTIVTYYFASHDSIPVAMAAKFPMHERHHSFDTIVESESTILSFCLIAFKKLSKF
jgi:hypothetical protein